MQHQWTEWDEDVESTPEEEYQSLVRSLRRKTGFGLFFVRCTPAGGQELIKKIRTDIPQKQADVLELKEPISNLIDLVNVFPNITNLKILFVVGLEKSLVEYIRLGYGGQGDYYNLDTVPPILTHLNWQRENFRDRFRHLCFVFLLPRFAIKYIIRRAPDFFDWGSGVTEFPTDKESVAQESQRLIQEADFQKYLSWSSSERTQYSIKIAELIIEPHQTPDRKAELLFEQGNISYAGKQYEEALTFYDRALHINPEYDKAYFMQGLTLGRLDRNNEEIASYDKALHISPDAHQVWQNRGIALYNLGRYEEAIASYNKAVQIKPDYHLAWNNRGNALRNLGRNEDAIYSYQQSLQFEPNDAGAYYNISRCYALLGNSEPAIENIQQAIQLNSEKYRELAKTDSDFDNIRHDPRFQALIQ